MSPLVVSVQALRRLADKEPAGTLRKCAHLDIDQVERAQWAAKVKPEDQARPVSLSFIKQQTDVEFGLWALKASEAADSADKSAPDRYGRLMAARLIWPALSWLDAAALTDHEVTHAHAQDMINDVQAGTLAENHYRWIGWADLIEAQAREAAWTWRGRALLAAVWCGQSLVTAGKFRKEGPPPVTARTLVRQGRHCAHAAYDTLMYAWVTANAGFRAAYEIADLGVNPMDGRHRADMDHRLQQLDEHLRVKADDVLKAVTEEAWNTIMEVKL